MQILDAVKEQVTRWAAPNGCCMQAAQPGQASSAGACGCPYVSLLSAQCPLCAWTAHPLILFPGCSPPRSSEGAEEDERAAYQPLKAHAQ